MCTALTYKSGDFYFGRTLDIEIDYGERVTVMPRSFPLPMRCTKDMNEHYALIGMAVVAEGYPLFFEATNEKGLSMAGLNFPDNAFYGEAVEGRVNLAPYELIPWLLGSCDCLAQAKEVLSQVTVAGIPFSDSLPLSPLHWIAADKSGALTIESTRDGLKIYDNPWGVLSNNPPFDEQRKNLETSESFGEFSSESRFVRGVRIKEKASPKSSEEARVAQFLRMLSLVSVPEGCVTKKGKAHYTRYSSCCNTDKGVYYVNRCDSYRVSKTEMKVCDLNGSKLWSEG